MNDPGMPARKLSLVAVVSIFIGVVVLWALTPVVISHVYPDLAHRGQAGDLFGSINALFSGLAFAGVIVAILLQREELELQRHEIAANRVELARAATAQEESRVKHFERPFMHRRTKLPWTFCKPKRFARHGA
jgi:hypothetical protein